MSVAEGFAVDQVSGVFGALGNATRIKILLLISETKRPLHIKAVAKALKMDYAAVYRHVQVLQENGLLEAFEVGRSRVLSPKRTELVKQMMETAKKLGQK